MIEVANPADLAAVAGRRLRAPEMSVDGDMIAAFCALTGDTNPIHGADSDPQIVPGNLLLSLVPKVLQSMIRLVPPASAVTAKYERVRFRVPVPAATVLEPDMAVVDLRTRGAEVFVTVDVRYRLADGTAAFDARVVDCYRFGG